MEQFRIFHMYRLKIVFEMLCEDGYSSDGCYRNIVGDAGCTRGCSGNRMHRRDAHAHAHALASRERRRVFGRLNGRCATPSLTWLSPNSRQLTGTTAMTRWRKRRLPLVIEISIIASPCLRHPRRPLCNASVRNAISNLESFLFLWSGYGVLMSFWFHLHPACSILIPFCCVDL